MKYFVLLSVLVCLLGVTLAASYAAKGSGRRSPAQSRRQPAKGGYDASGSAGVPAEEEHPAPEPYSFNYGTDDGEAKVERSEEGDASGTVKGQYSIVGPDGITRTVTYTADASGFHAQVSSNEPGLVDPNNPEKPENPADVEYQVQPAPAGAYESQPRKNKSKRKSSRNYY